ncbi:MAG: WYL domain-containing protein [Bacteroidales bacterium]|nr:WYL domain-containing protein [Bacteroidales bacterium]
MVSELLKKYIWLVQTFIRAGERGLSLAEVEEKWESRFDSDYSRRTFNNHREAVEEVFGIQIECNRSTNRYFIRYTEDVSDENAERAWLINTFTVNNMLNLGKERLSGRVSVEDVPSGHMHLTAVMEAMTEGLKLKISYLKYTSSEPESLTVHPYAVKEFAKRWYLVAYCEEREALRVYGLDRIKGLAVSEEAFAMPEGFEVDGVFATSFGPYIPEGKAQLITFRTTAKEAKFLRDLPLHKSQEEIPGDDDGHVMFNIFVCPDESLIMEFCKHGRRIEVLSPASVRNAVAAQLTEAASLYSAI